MRHLGPNVKRLISERAAQLQIESVKKTYGACGVGEVAASIVADSGKVLLESMREAVTFVQAALKAVRAAPGSEEWPDDEAIAGEILRKIKGRKSGIKA